MNNIIDLNGEVYVLSSFLTEYGVNKGTIYNGFKKFRNNDSLHYDHFTDSIDKRLKWLRFGSIPLLLLRKYPIPTEKNLLDDLNQSKLEKNERFILTRFNYAIERGYYKYKIQYHGLFYDVDSINRLAKKHAFIAVCLEMYNYGLTIKEMFKIYQFWNFEILSDCSAKTFYRRILRYKKEGDSSIVHGSLGRLKNSKIINEKVFSQLKELYRDKKMFTGREIHFKLNQWCLDNGYKSVSHSSIKSVISKPEFMNENKIHRYGKEWTKYFWKPYSLRTNPHFNGSLWQLDGTRIQIPYLTTEGKESFLWIFVVMDVHSRKIVGFSIDTAERKGMILNALRNAIETTRYIPMELVRDNAKAFESKEYKYVEDYLSYFGTYTRKHIPGEPQDKGHVERFFGTFQTTVLKNHKGYIGEGIRGRRETSRPDRAMVLESRKKKNLRNKEELEKLIKNSITEYNNNRIHEEVPSPSAKFDVAKKDKNSINFSINDIALLFWNQTQITVKNSMVILSKGKRNHIKYQYIIHKESLRYSLNQTVVKVCYQEFDRSIIKLYNEHDLFISDLKLSTPVDIVQKRSRVITSRPIKSHTISRSAEKESNPKNRIRPENQIYKIQAINNKIKEI